MRPGEVICADGPIVLNAGRATKVVRVTNKGDRPVQVGSHFHFFEVNRCLEFDRAAAFGFRLDVPSGNSVRFEPGEEKDVQLVELGGAHAVYGCNDLTRGRTVARNEAASLEKARRRGFLSYEEGPATGFPAGWDADTVTGEADEEEGAADATPAGPYGSPAAGGAASAAGDGSAAAVTPTAGTATPVGATAPTCTFDASKEA